MISVPVAALSMVWLGLPAAPQAVELASTFPEMVISRQTSSHEWPFSVPEGELTCVDFQGQKHVFFAEILTDEQAGEIGNMTLPRMVVVTANPLAYFASIEDRDLYAPYDTLETLIVRLAPFERMGWDLCEAGQAGQHGKKS